MRAEFAGVEHLPRQCQRSEVANPEGDIAKTSTSSLSARLFEHLLRIIAGQNELDCGGQKAGECPGPTGRVKETITRAEEIRDPRGRFGEFLIPGARHEVVDPGVAIPKAPLEHLRPLFPARICPHDHLM